MVLPRLTFCFAILALAIASVTGCGGNSNLGTVTGTITLDGEPLSGALVSFKPESGRASAGKTDGNGVYRLRYVKTEMGAVIGTHVVTVTVPPVAEESRGEVDYGPDGSTASTPTTPRRSQKSLPARYSSHKDSELGATVSSGKNTIDFDLTSQ